LREALACKMSGTDANNFDECYKTKRIANMVNDGHHHRAMLLAASEFSKIFQQCDGSATVTLLQSECESPLDFLTKYQQRCQDDVDDAAKIANFRNNSEAALRDALEWDEPANWREAQLIVSKIHKKFLRDSGPQILTVAAKTPPAGAQQQQQVDVGVVISPGKSKTCHFWLGGYCAKGTQCPNGHPPEEYSSNAKLSKSTGTIFSKGFQARKAENPTEEKEH
jgi:hypothetical protein